jgi:hypothetical protein
MSAAEKRLEGGKFPCATTVAMHLLTPEFTADRAALPMRSSQSHHSRQQSNIEVQNRPQEWAAHREVHREPVTQCFDAVVDTLQCRVSARK